MMTYNRQRLKEKTLMLLYQHLQVKHLNQWMSNHNLKEMNQKQE